MDFQRIYESSNDPYDNYPPGVSSADFYEKPYPEDEVDEAVRYYEDDLVAQIKKLGVTDDKHAAILADNVIVAIEQAVYDDVESVYSDNVIDDAFQYLYVTPEDLEKATAKYETTPSPELKKRIDKYKYVLKHNSEFLQYGDKVFDENGEFKDQTALDEVYAIVEEAISDAKGEVESSYNGDKGYDDDYDRFDPRK